MSFELSQIIQNALSEDMPHGDVTTDNLGIHDRLARARIVAKEDLVLSGCEIADQVFKTVDQKIAVDWAFHNGQFVLNKQTVCTLRGPSAAMLKAERVALNFLGRMSGIATITRCYVEQTMSPTRILDTRKTTPGLREIEKAAVRHGGGHNHRMNLSEAVLVKENHGRAAGGLALAINKIKKNHTGPIEVEVRNLDEVKIAIENKVSRILLDNMTNDEIENAMKIIPRTIEVEASGNMTVARVASVAKLGVHYISVGAITHSAPNADLSLLFDEI